MVRVCSRQTTYYPALAHPIRENPPRAARAAQCSILSVAFLARSTGTPGRFGAETNFTRIIGRCIRTGGTGKGRGGGRILEIAQFGAKGGYVRDFSELRKQGGRGLPQAPPL